ncbi:MAG: polysaccharide deacetylase family protein [Deltaproteobacteria bacterium]|nr:MAG: polysaccharide deacetylase family protein [Deltaproteobacteria bacterium]
MLKISILMYHQIGVFDRPREHRATFCHIRRFKAQMAYLRLFGYKVVSLEEALKALYLKNEKGDYQHAVVLTFDDGYKNFFEYAFPVLSARGYPATVFLVAGLLGKNAKWLADDGRYAPELLDVDTIRKLHSQGVTFGSHSLTHPRLTALDPRAMEREIIESKSILEALLGHRVHYFCYPGGIYNEMVVAKVREAGYDAALTCDRGAATMFDDPFLLPRKAISFGDSLLGYFWKLHMKHKKKLQRQPLA